MRKQYTKNTKPIDRITVDPSVMTFVGYNDIDLMTCKQTSPEHYVIEQIGTGAKRYFQSTESVVVHLKQEQDILTKQLIDKKFKVWLNKLKNI